MLSFRRFCFVFVLIALFAYAGSGFAQQPTGGYNSRSRNADGSLRFALELGGGYDIAHGQTRLTQTRGWNALVGAGYSLNRHVTFLGEYTFDHFSVPANAVQSSDLSGARGDIHLSSITANGMYHYFATQHWGGYVVGGGGWYYKASVISSACVNGSSSCGPADSSTAGSSQAGGFEAGTGLAWRVSDNSNAKMFAEVRYVQTGAMSDLFLTKGAAPSVKMTFVPVRAGIRW